jgi:hypothetical protein
MAKWPAPGRTPAGLSVVASASDSPSSLARCSSSPLQLDSRWEPRSVCASPGAAWQSGRVVALATLSSFEALDNNAANANTSDRSEWCGGAPRRSISGLVVPRQRCRIGWQGNVRAHRRRLPEPHQLWTDRWRVVPLKVVRPVRSPQEIAKARLGAPLLKSKRSTALTALPIQGSPQHDVASRALFLSTRRRTFAGPESTPLASGMPTPLHSERSRQAI